MASKYDQSHDLVLTFSLPSIHPFDRGISNGCFESRGGHVQYVMSATILVPSNFSQVLYTPKSIYTQHVGGRQTCTLILFLQLTTRNKSGDSILMPSMERGEKSGNEASWDQEQQESIN